VKYSFQNKKRTLHSILLLLLRHFFAYYIQPDLSKQLSENSHILLPQSVADLGCNNMEPDGINFIYDGCSESYTHIFFLGNYLFRMYEIHAQYNWMFPLHMLFFHIISIYAYGLTPARNKGMHAFPVPARFLST
jgi:hypothetical protein